MNARGDDVLCGDEVVVLSGSEERQRLERVVTNAVQLEVVVDADAEVHVVRVHVVVAEIGRVVCTQQRTEVHVTSSTYVRLL